jgi:hypothetical protein
MSTDSTELHRSAAASAKQPAQPIEAETAAQALRDGQRGALILAGTAVALLFIGWLAFYFLLFLPRGSVG